jgi:hypothetical protein
VGQVVASIQADPKLSPEEKAKITERMLRAMRRLS